MGLFRWHVLLMAFKTAKKFECNFLFKDGALKYTYIPAHQKLRKWDILGIFI